MGRGFSFQHIIITMFPTVDEAAADELTVVAVAVFGRVSFLSKRFSKLSNSVLSVFYTASQLDQGCLFLVLFMF